MIKIFIIKNFLILYRHIHNYYVLKTLIIMTMTILCIKNIKKNKK